MTPETAESVPFISASLDDSYKQLEGLNVRQRDLFREALESVKNGLFRSAHVMAWAAFMDYLAGYMKSRLPTDTVDKLVGQRSDNQIIRHAADVGLCSQAEMSQFLGWLTTRNRCAHPDDFSPNLGMTSGYIAALLYEIKALQARSH